MALIPRQMPKAMVSSLFIEMSPSVCVSGGGLLLPDRPIDPVLSRLEAHRRSVSRWIAALH